MSINENLNQIKNSIPTNVTLVAVSKTKPNEDILEAYNAGHKIFGENKVQELTDKYQNLPKDIEWHMIGHLQRNKVKFIAPFVSLIHGVDSFRLLSEINKRAEQNNRVINCLLQVYIAQEETKFGLDTTEITQLLNSPEFKTLKNVQVIGLMGMASNTSDEKQIKKEFSGLKTLFDELKLNIDSFSTLSMGMSSDFMHAIECGSNMIRVGSAVFGARNYN